MSDHLEKNGDSYGGRSFFWNCPVHVVALFLFFLTLTLCPPPTRSQWTISRQEDLPGVTPPLVNKCCELHQRYDNGTCVDTGISTGGQPTYSDPPLTFKNEKRNSSEHPVVFQLRSAQPICENGVIEKLIDGDQPWQQRHPEDAESNGTYSDVYLSPEGSLLWVDENNHMNHQYDNFCVDQVNSNISTFVARICKPKCSDQNPCVRKCCKPDDIVDVQNGQCVPAPIPWRQYLYSTDLERWTERNDTSIHFVVGVPRCDVFMLDMRKDMDRERFYALTNGSVLTLRGDHQHVYQTDFCVDGVIGESYEGEFSEHGIDYNFSSYNGLESDQIAIICLPEQNPEEEDMMWLYPLFAGVMFISAIFLILTAAVYLILWEYQNIHGWLQFSYVVSLLFAFSFLAFVQLFSQTLLDNYTQICEIFGPVIHFSFLSAFFWLTSMNFDLWFTFSGCRPLRASTRTGEKKRFALFGLLSWGCAILISSTGVILDYNYKHSNNTDITKYLPLFGENKCYFHNEEAKLPFFYAPIGLLLLVNLIFFLSTILSLHKLQKDTRFATRQSSRQDKKRFVLFLKLFVLMGVCWIFEMVSWLSLLLYPDKMITLKLSFLPTDILNALQGIFIFIIFTCKPNTCKQLEGQFKKLSVRLEESRDKSNGGISQSQLSQFCAIGFCSIILPIVHALRKLFSYCGRPTRSLEGQRTISHNTVTSTFEKSRKASDSSACTTLSVVEAGSYEMDTTY